MASLALKDITGKYICVGDRVVYTEDRSTDLLLGVITEINANFIIVQHNYAGTRRFRHTSSDHKIAIIE